MVLAIFYVKEYEYKTCPDLTAVKLRGDAARAFLRGQRTMTALLKTFAQMRKRFHCC